MSKKPGLGAGLRAEMEQGITASPPIAEPSFMRAKPGRPVQNEGEGRGVRPRAVLASGERRKAVVSYLHPDVSLWLKQLAATEETTVNALVGEALDLLRRARGEHPFGER
jgi:hypothetical protein